MSICYILEIVTKTVGFLIKYVHHKSVIRTYGLTGVINFNNNGYFSKQVNK